MVLLFLFWTEEHLKEKKKKNKKKKVFVFLFQEWFVSRWFVTACFKNRCSWRTACFKNRSSSAALLRRIQRKEMVLFAVAQRKEKKRKEKNRLFQELKEMLVSRKQWFVSEEPLAVLLFQKTRFCLVASRKEGFVSRTRRKEERTGVVFFSFLWILRSSRRRAVLETSSEQHHFFSFLWILRQRTAPFLFFSLSDSEQHHFFSFLFFERQRTAPFLFFNQVSFRRRRKNQKKNQKPGIRNQKKNQEPRC